jgi:hypothetical protein
MGLEPVGIKLLLYGKKLGVDFTKTAMIGRQQLCLSREELQRLLAEMRLPATEEQLAKIVEKKHCYAEEFFRHLGAAEVESFDVSDYEKATHLVDLNQPIPEEFKERYSLVIDAGSLEHVFNFPTAMRNCMEMIREGGYYIGITPANNFFGHGFYQFSPELFYTIFTAANGFELTKMVVFEDVPKGHCYEVRSPEAVGGRVTMTSTIGVYLFVIARRTSIRPIFRQPPQQSDYVAVWEGIRANNYPISPAGFKQFAQKYLPVLIRIRKAIWLETAFSNRTFFVPLDFS